VAHRTEFPERFHHARQHFFFVFEIFDQELFEPESAVPVVITHPRCNAD
jgi:hypothetical protein